jgi:hypothetical protein
MRWPGLPATSGRRPYPKYWLSLERGRRGQGQLQRVLHNQEDRQRLAQTLNSPLPRNPIGGTLGKHRWRAHALVPIDQQAFSRQIPDSPAGVVQGLSVDVDDLLGPRR